MPFSFSFSYCFSFFTCALLPGIETPPVRHWFDRRTNKGAMELLGRLPDLADRRCAAELELRPR
jgi:hypothetical protein